MPYDITQYSPGYGGTINSSGNVVNIADTLDEATGQFKPPAMKQFTFQSGATALGNGTVADVSGYSTLAVRVTFGGTATVTFEGSTDNTNFFTIVATNNNGTSSLTNTSNNGDFRLNVAGIKYVRVRVSVYTSGTVDVIGYASTGVYQQPNGQVAQYGNSDSNTAGNSVQGVGAYNLLFDGTNWVRQRSVISTADGGSGSGLSSTALMGFNGTTWDRVRTINTGQLRTTLYSSTGVEPRGDATNDGSSGTGAIATSQMGWVGASFDRVRIGRVYKYIEYLNLANATATTVWTPAAGKKFRLMGVMIGLGATNGLVHLRDGAGGSAFFTARDANAASIQFSFGNGYLSGLADRVLEVYNATGSTINVWVHAWGTEE